MKGKNCFVIIFGKDFIHFLLKYNFGKYSNFFNKRSTFQVFFFSLRHFEPMRVREAMITATNSTWQLPPPSRDTLTYTSPPTVSNYIRLGLSLSISPVYLCLLVSYSGLLIAALKAVANISSYLELWDHKIFLSPLIFLYE